MNRIVPFEEADWITTAQAMKVIREVGESCRKSLTEYETNHPNSKYLKPETFGFDKKDYSKLKMFLEPFDWRGFTFHDPDDVTKVRDKDLLPKQDRLNGAQTTQHVQTTQSSTQVPTARDTQDLVLKYLTNEMLIHDPEATQIVQIFWEACTVHFVRFACMTKKSCVLSSIELNDDDNNISSACKVIIQMFCDILQMQLDITPLTIPNHCKFDYTLSMAWDMLGVMDESLAQSIFMANQDDVNWYTSELCAIELLTNLLHSARYLCSNETWIEYGLRVLQGNGYLNENALCGIFSQGASYTMGQILQFIEHDVKLLSDSPLVVLREIRYVCESVFNILNDDDNSVYIVEIPALISKIYLMGSKMNWTWFTNMINNVSLDAISNNYTTQTDLVHLIDELCTVAAAWRAIGRLGAFDANNLVKNKDLKELWTTFVICGLTTIIHQCIELEKDYQTLNALFTMFESNDTGMSHIFCTTLLFM